MVEVEQELPELSVEGGRRAQQVVGTLLFYSRQVNPTILTDLSLIAAEQNNDTASTAQAVTMLLDYIATNLGAKIRSRCSKMVLYIHNNVSYLSEKKAQSSAAGYFYLGEEKVDKIKKQNAAASMRMAEKPSHYKWALKK
eukprot:8266120-Ditylum_brightwellii.AAC.1